VSPIGQDYLKLRGHIRTSSYKQEVTVAAFAQFVLIPGADNPLSLSGATSGPTKRCLEPTFNLENVDTTRTSVLMFMLKTEGRGRLSMKINEIATGVDVSFDSSDSKSWRSFHEIMGKGVRLNESGNKLCLELTGADATSKVQISDPIMLYHASS
jgi:hypothetical protein